MSGAKRLMHELQALADDPDPAFCAAPLDGDLFEWHFSVRGPPDSDFAGGIFHGRILFPPDYPFKPPSIVLLTPNGRWEVGVKICLNASGYHPEEWKPSWSVKTLLLALIAFMPTHGEGAVGAVELSPAQRRDLAAKSRSWKCPRCGVDHSSFSPLPQQQQSPAAAAAAAVEEETAAAAEQKSSPPPNKPTAAEVLAMLRERRKAATAAAEEEESAERQRMPQQQRMQRMENGADGGLEEHQLRVRKQLLDTLIFLTAAFLVLYILRMWVRPRHN